MEENGLLRRENYRVTYEDLGPDPIEVDTSHRGWFWASVIAFALAVVMVLDYRFGSDPEAGAALFYAGFGALFLAIYLWSRESLVIYPAGSLALVFWRGRPSPSALASFVDQLRAEQRAFLRQEYGPNPSPVSIADELERLDALRDRGVLSDEEFAKLKSELVDGTPPSFLSLN